MRSMTLAVMACGLALSACGGDDGGDGNGGGTTRLTGTLVGPAGESGVLEVVVEDEGTQGSGLSGLAGASPGADGGTPATGTITWTSGGTVSLSGTVMSVTLQLAGEGYTLNGVWADGGLQGTYSGPNGSGSFTAGLAEEVRVYCGTYAETGGAGETGTWNMVVSGDTLTGLARNDMRDATDSLSGTLAADGTFTLNGGLAQGTITGDDVSGTYDSGSSQGTFTGSRCD